ncbi:MAG TPA: gliding motility-associated C-terminal domain-containing protein [Cyclobacteriaceae bacterium]|nr:gliding motility-associated C-terminal domain-containing protein [Cyclobacteriaceae bacterium]
MPNIFTPDNDDGINDSFPGIIKTSNQKTDPVTCPRFVKSIDLTIFNRWGEEVYLINTASQQFSSEWSGRDSSGRELPAGIYFYKADINFNTMDPALQNQNSRGWVNLVR